MGSIKSPNCFWLETQNAVGVYWVRGSSVGFQSLETSVVKAVKEASWRKASTWALKEKASESIPGEQDLPEHAAPMLLAWCPVVKQENPGNKNLRAGPLPSGKRSSHSWEGSVEATYFHWLFKNQKLKNILRLGKYGALVSETKREWVLLRTQVNRRSCVCPGVVFHLVSVKQDTSCRGVLPPVIPFPPALQAPGRHLECSSFWGKSRGLFWTQYLWVLVVQANRTPHLTSVPQPWARKAIDLQPLENKVPAAKASTSLRRAGPRGCVWPAGLWLSVLLV